MENTSSEQVDSSYNVELAGAGPRFLAALIDGLIALPFYFIDMSLYYVVSIGYGLTKDALPFLDGQSLGKKAMKILVVKEETKEKITNDWGTAIIRTISLYIPIFGIVDALMVFGSDKKRFGDKWAKTIVIKDPEA